MSESKDVEQNGSRFAVQVPARLGDIAPVLEQLRVRALFLGKAIPRWLLRGALVDPDLDWLRCTCGPYTDLEDFAEVLDALEHAQVAERVTALLFLT